MTDEKQNKQKFTVINGERSENNFRKERLKNYQTNPLNIQGNSLREQFMKFTNCEVGRRFTVEDLLRS